jgi:hypothetical protein
MPTLPPDEMITWSTLFSRNLIACPEGLLMYNVKSVGLLKKL